MLDQIKNNEILVEAKSHTNMSSPTAMSPHSLYPSHRNTSSTDLSFMKLKSQTPTNFDEYINFMRATNNSAKPMGKSKLMLEVATVETLREDNEDYEDSKSLAKSQSIHPIYVHKSRSEAGAKSPL